MAIGKIITAKKIIHDHLDLIYNTAAAVAKEWNIKTVPLNTLKKIIEKSKPVATGSGSQALDEHNAAYCNTLNVLYENSEIIAAEMGASGVPLSVLKQGIDIIKSAY